LNVAFVKIMCEQRRLDARQRVSLRLRNDRAGDVTIGCDQLDQSLANRWHRSRQDGGTRG
jgi:hypothetical protein